MRLSTGFPVSLLTDATDLYKLQRSRSRAMSFRRYTWCAIRRSCDIYRRLQSTRRAVPNQPHDGNKARGGLGGIRHMKSVCDREPVTSKMAGNLTNAIRNFFIEDV